MIYNIYLNIIKVNNIVLIISMCILFKLFTKCNTYYITKNNLKKKHVNHRKLTLYKNTSQRC